MLKVFPEIIVQQTQLKNTLFGEDKKNVSCRTTKTRVPPPVVGKFLLYIS